MYNRDMNSRLLLALIATATVSTMILAFGSNRKQTAQSIQWNLIWSDEFNGSGAVNGSDWIYDTGTAYAGSGCPSNWGTGEVEVMSSSTDNVFQSNGDLNIRALHSGGSATSGWTSGRIETVRTDFQPPTGGAMAVEARLQQPNVDTSNGLGYWPAFWMLGGAFRGNCPSWPGIGEIDITEDINGRSSEFATLHCGSYPGGPCNEPTGLSSGERSCAGCQTAFHTYRVEFDKSVSPEEIRWYLDGANFFTLRSNQIDATTWNNATNHGFFLSLIWQLEGAFRLHLAEARPPLRLRDKASSSIMSASSTPQRQHQHQHRHPRQRLRQHQPQHLVQRLTHGFALGQWSVQ